ncbi:MAG: methyltransferase domain-containing protein [Candidatus Binatia bacterium]
MRTFDDYARIPILTRGDVLENLDELWSRAFRRDDLLLLGTGGSTGVPMHYYKDVAYLDRSQVVLARSQQWAGKGRWELLAHFGSKREPSGLRGEVKRLLRALTERRLYFDTFAAAPGDLAQWVSVLRRYRPRFAYGYPSMLEYFSRWAIEAGVELPPFAGVLVSAETLHPHQAELLSTVFRAPIFNFYGSREVQNIGATCVAQRMHQVADWVYAEFVHDAGLPAPRVVVTPFECWGMPLIRYANGDLASAVTGSCACGLPFPLMGLDVTRVVDVFVMPDGTRVYGQFFTHLLYGVGGVRQFQFHQTAVDRIRLRVVRDRDFDAESERKLGEVVRDIHKKAGPEVRVDIEYVEDIPRTAAGKHIFTRSDVWARQSDVSGSPRPELQDSGEPPSARSAASYLTRRRANEALWSDRAQRHGRQLEATASTAWIRRGTIRRLRRIVRQGDRVLEVGCGNGNLVAEIGRVGRAFGADITFAMLEVARQRGDAIAGLARADAASLPFRDASFDVVYTSRCHINVLDRAMQQHALRELLRVANPGGTVVLIENFEAPVQRLNAAKRRWNSGPPEIDAHNLRLDLELTLRTCAELGWKPVQVLGYPLSSGVAHLLIGKLTKRHGGRVAERCLGPLFSVITRIDDVAAPWLPLFGKDTTVVLRRTGRS